jgi:hypothetical protein
MIPTEFFWEGFAKKGRGEVQTFSQAKLTRKSKTQKSRFGVQTKNIFSL